MSADPDPTELYDVLRADGVLEDSGEDRLTFTEAFSRRREKYRREAAALDGDAYASTAAEFVDEESDFTAEDVDEGLLADALAVRESCGSLDPTTCLHVALAIDRSESTRDEPVPEGFLVLSAAEIDRFIGRRTASILYFWRRDCDPCETVKGHLESTLSGRDIPPEVGLGAIYGPDHVQTLREEYDVGAAPTVLFCRGDSVESRFVGDPGEGAIENEVRLLLEDVDA